MIKAQLNEANLSFPEARDRLQNKIKEDNALIMQLDKRQKECQKILDNLEKRLRD
jgi:intraflagellar transport protein 74